MSTKADRPKQQPAQKPPADSMGIYGPPRVPPSKEEIAKAAKRLAEQEGVTPPPQPVPASGGVYAAARHPPVQRLEDVAGRVGSKPRRTAAEAARGLGFDGTEGEEDPDMQKLLKQAQAEALAAEKRLAKIEQRITTLETGYDASDEERLNNLEGRITELATLVAGHANELGGDSIKPPRSKG